jgi:hypothetical protein
MSADVKVAPWSITIFREPQPKPFDHKFRLAAKGCDCAWVCRSLAAAMRLVDVSEFHITHPEFPVPDGALGIHIRHGETP